jgi:aminoglycoside N3'-acetyltransferase
MTETITIDDIRQAVRSLDLSGRPLCIHSSLRSFGRTAQGARTIIDGLLAEDCTILVPAFSQAAFAIAPPECPEMRPARNGIDYERSTTFYMGFNQVYTPESPEIDLPMGVIPEAIVEDPTRVRGNNALNSFAALGPLAQTLVADQCSDDVYAPLRVLVEMQGWIILMGVGLERMTFLHYAEQASGRELFRRWANGPDQQPLMVSVGSCSEGFGHFAPVLQDLKRQIQVGQSMWQIFPSRETLSLAVKAIRENAYITHCANPACLRCQDSIQGGPLL